MWRALQPKKPVMGELHCRYDVYTRVAFKKVLDAAIAWYKEDILPAM